MDIFSIISGIYAITPDEPLNYQHIVKYLEKINILQYRRPNIGNTQKYNEVSQLQQLLKPHNIPLIINDDIELAVKTNATGVHLGKNDENIKSAKQKLKPTQIIGISCYNDLERAKVAQEQGADYVAFGRIFNSQTKPDAPFCSLDIIKQAKEILSIPVVAIGGITMNNKAEVFSAGADAVAMIKGLSDV